MSDMFYCNGHQIDHDKKVTKGYCNFYKQLTFCSEELNRLTNINPDLSYGYVELTQNNDEKEICDCRCCE